MKRTLLSAVALLALAGSFAIGQVSAPMLPSLNQNDITNVVPYGVGTAQQQYVNIGQISSLEGYSYQVPLTAFTITSPNGIGRLYLNPAGTLATGTLTMMAQPSDGQRFCLEDSQTQTAITISANTGQTLTSSTYGLTTPTALTANTSYCWLYFKSQAAWVRYS